MKKIIRMFTLATCMGMASIAWGQDEGNVYIGIGVNGLALDNERVIGRPTSSPGHSSKIVSGILGYQFNSHWALDLMLGTDFDGEVATDQGMLNLYHFFTENSWRPYISAGVSALDVDQATVDSSTEQVQVGLGLSGALSNNVELRLGYQALFDLGDESYQDNWYGLSLNYHFRKPPVVAASEPVAAPAAPVQKEVIDRYELIVEFDFDKADIKSHYAPQFQEIADVLTESTDITMTIEGHTDWTGPEEYNQGLSERRANAVKDKFVQDYGISESRIDTIGFGESQPIADNSTREGRQRNRRAISVILRPRIVTE